jgi:trimethylamine---corrinoid protein Co-methyltransferase
MRPTLRFLTDELVEKIIAEARRILAEFGVEIHNDSLLARLGDQGAAVNREKNRVYINGEIIDLALQTAPASFRLYDVHGKPTHDLSGYNVHFTPGSAAIHVLDYAADAFRKPTTVDYVQYARLMRRLDHLAAQSTAFIPTDVHARISDSYRLYLSLLHCEKPCVTGAFTIEAFEVMRDLQIAVRGSAEKLRTKPLTIFSCCPTAPLKWSDVTSQNVVDCATWGIPVEFISMPLAGFVAPVTLVGSLIQHTAETLSGLVISQLVSPGAPVLWGGSPAIFDVRYETTPMGAIETMMLDCAYNEIGKYLGLPTQAYIALSDAKQLDAQAGLETSMGATLAALSGINSISGPGMLDFENCISLEKLVVDNEIAGMTLRMLRGVEPREDFPSRAIFDELLREGHLLIARHTRKHLKQEHYMPGPAIDRANRARWMDEGGLALRERAHNEVRRLLSDDEPSTLSDTIKADLTERMRREARRYGMTSLPGDIP